MLARYLRLKIKIRHNEFANKLFYKYLRIILIVLETMYLDVQI